MADIGEHERRQKTRFSAAKPRYGFLQQRFLADERMKLLRRSLSR
jgi:hypothetical protein